MKCIYCGTELKEGCLYCSNCGKEAQIVPDYNGFEDDYLKALLEEASSEETELAQATIKKADMEEKERKIQEKRQKQTELKKKQDRKRIIVLLCILAAVILFFVISTVVLKLSREHQQMNSYEYQMEQAAIAEQNKEYALAAQYYENALALEPQDLISRDRLGELYMNQKEYDSALIVYTELIQLGDTSLENYQNLLTIYEKKKDVDAIIALTKEIEDPQILELFTNYIVTGPEFSYPSGKYEEYIKVELSSSGIYNIYYTLDGSDPVTNGQIYTKPIALSEAGEYEIRAVCVNIKHIYSEVVSNTYTIDIPAPDMPSVSPNGGDFASETQIIITVPTGCIAYYTWDGTNPTTESEQYTAPIVIPEGNNILSVISVDPKTNLTSGVYRQYYTYYP